MKSHFLFVVVFCLLGLIKADAFKLQSSFSKDIIPERTIERDETGITVTYTFPGAIAIEDNLYPGQVRLDIPMFGHHEDLGEPAWPVRGDSFEIPDGYDATVTVTEAAWCNLDITLGPARPLLIDSSDEVHSLDNVPPVKEFVGSLPENPVAIYDRQVYRDRPIIYVMVAPVRCFDNKKTMACKKLVYRINFTPSKTIKKSNSDKIRHEVDEEYMNSLYTSVLPEDSKAMTTANIFHTIWGKAPYYLILTLPEYQSYVEEFAEWKRCMGFNTEIIYNEYWTAENIKETIQSKYDSLPHLQYALLVGDYYTMPPKDHLKENDYTYKHLSDYTYGCMDGDDDLDQYVIIGRLNVSLPEELQGMIRKIITYEKTPPTKDSYYTQCLHSAYFQDNNSDGYEDRRFVRTSEDIINGLTSEGYSVKRVYSTNSENPSFWNNAEYGNGEALPPYLMSNNLWRGNKSNVIESINDGLFYVLHRGHGYNRGWGIPDFDTSSFSKIKNESLTPICFSINCQTGAFSGSFVVDDIDDNTTVQVFDSFSEVFMRDSVGFAGIISASEISFSGHNDVLAMEMFQAIWPESNILTTFPHYTPGEINHNATPEYSIGRILQRAKNRLSEVFIDKKTELHIQNESFIASEIQACKCIPPNL